MRLLTYDEAGKVLRLSESTVRRLVRIGKIRANKMGRSVRIPYHELMRYVRDSAKEQHEPPSPNA